MYFYEEDVRSFYYYFFRRKKLLDIYCKMFDYSKEEYSDLPNKLNRLGIGTFEQCDPFLFHFKTCFRFSYNNKYLYYYDTHLLRKFRVKVENKHALLRRIHSDVKQAKRNYDEFSAKLPR